jgi:2'-5' RNA ligase
MREKLQLTRGDCGHFVRSKAPPWESRLALLPPASSWGPIQAIRQRYDRQVLRWPPHINAVYPFRPLVDFPSAAAAITEVSAGQEPLTVTLAEFRFFRHASGRCTLWLASEPQEQVRRLQQALQVIFPDCKDLSRFSSGFTPHLSVGQFGTVVGCQRVATELQAAWQPITFSLAEVSLLARQGDAPFVVERRIILGAAPANDQAEKA